MSECLKLVNSIVPSFLGNISALQLLLLFLMALLNHAQTSYTNFMTPIHKYSLPWVNNEDNCRLSRSQASHPPLSALATMRCHTAAAAPEKEFDCRHILQVRARDGWRMLQYKRNRYRQRNLLSGGGKARAVSKARRLTVASGLVLCGSNLRWTKKMDEVLHLFGSPRIRSSPGILTLVCLMVNGG